MLPVIVTVGSGSAGSPLAGGLAAALTTVLGLAPDVVHVSQQDAAPSADGWCGVVFVRAVDAESARGRVAELVCTVAGRGSFRVWSPDAPGVTEVIAGRDGLTAASGHVPLRTPEGLGRPTDR